MSALLAGIGFGMFIIWLATTILFFFANWTIVKKAGYHPALSLLILIPFVNIICFFVFAFSSWPNRRDMPQKAITTA